MNAALVSALSPGVFYTTWGFLTQNHAYASEKHSIRSAENVYALLKLSGLTETQAYLFPLLLFPLQRKRTRKWTRWFLTKPLEIKKPHFTLIPMLNVVLNIIKCLHAIITFASFLWFEIQESFRPGQSMTHGICDRHQPLENLMLLRCHNAWWHREIQRTSQSHFSYPLSHTLCLFLSISLFLSFSHSHTLPSTHTLTHIKSIWPVKSGLIPCTETNLVQICSLHYWTVRQKRVCRSQW